MVSTRAYEGEGGQRPSRRIASDLRAAIERGEYLAGHQLPSGSTLMARYGVARQTVQNAFDLLRAEGLVITRAGAGVFVKEHPPVQRLSPTRLSRPARKVGKAGFLADAASGGFTPTVETTVRVEAADERIADALDIEPGADVLVRDRATERSRESEGRSFPEVHFHFRYVLLTFRRSKSRTHEMKNAFLRKSAGRRRSVSLTLLRFASFR